MKKVHAVDNKIHIKINSDHVQNDEAFKFIMLEKMIQANYNGAKITRNINEYGLLTDLWIEFKSASDVTHFKLSWQSR